MKVTANILIGTGVVCFIIAIFSKLTSAGLYGMGIQPISAMVFGNSCLLLALVIRTFKSN